MTGNLEAQAKTNKVDLPVGLILFYNTITTKRNDKLKKGQEKMIPIN